MGLRQWFFGFTVIFVTYLNYGNKQEDVLRPREDNRESFTYSGFLQVLEAGANVIVGLLLMLILESVRWVPRLHVHYSISGVLQVTAKYFVTHAMVLGISFPVAKLGKSCKLVPVMIGSLLIGKARYNARAYVHVVLIVAGTTLVYMGQGSTSRGTSTAKGIGFLCAALVCDGIVGGTQKDMKETFTKMGLKQRAFEMQFFTNLYMFLTAAVFTYFNGEFKPAWEFLDKYPDIWKDIRQLAMWSAFGQLAIFYVISRFDPLVCTTMTTTRKVFSVLLSVLLKDHRLNKVGWGGIFLAFAGILADLREKYSASKTEGKDVRAARKTRAKTM